VAIFHRVTASCCRPTSIHIFRAEKEWGLSNTGIPEPSSVWSMLSPSPLQRNSPIVATTIFEATFSGLSFARVARHYRQQENLKPFLRQLLLL
jgi:hypothetical protein